MKNILLNFFWKNLMFSFTITAISFILCWLMFNLALKKHPFKDSLFKSDNLAAWVDFIGAFFFPALYLSASAIQGSAHVNIFIDLGICAIYAVVYVALFAIFKMSSVFIVRFINIKDSKGFKMNLNKEIYEKKNISAALFSVSLSVIFTNLVSFVDIDPGYLSLTLLRILLIVLLTLGAVIAYPLLQSRNYSLIKEMLIDNNTAVGISFTGYIFAVEMILGNAVKLQSVFNFYELAAFSVISIFLFYILSFVLKFILIKLIKVNIKSEIYDQNNIGAAIGQIALCIGVANVIIHYLK